MYRRQVRGSGYSESSLTPEQPPVSWTNIGRSFSRQVCYTATVLRVHQSMAVQGLSISRVFQLDLESYSHSPDAPLVTSSAAKPDAVGTKVA